MNYDLNILWIEDSGSWLEPAKEFFLLKVEEADGLLINIKTISSGDEIKALSDSIKKESLGFKLYDIIFVDYNISNEINGDRLIEEFRNSNIDADILFYSDKLNSDQQKEKMKNYEFSGIYVSTKENFQENAIKIYDKNKRRLTSLLNIRGMLTDKTSENDFVIKSYLVMKYADLLDKQKKQVSQKVNELLKERISIVTKSLEKSEKLSDNETHDIEMLCKLPDFLFTITNKYQIFYEILNIVEDKKFNDYSLRKYKKEIINMRNNVAHKKIEICKQQGYLKYYDTLKEYKERVCSEDCSLHSDDYKISLKKWLQTLKLANEYSKCFDEILNDLDTGDSN